LVAPRAQWSGRWLCRSLENFVKIKAFAIIASESLIEMGKGDKKSKKGKRWMGSYGNSRKRTSIKARLKRSLLVKPVLATVDAVETVEAKPKAKRTTKKKAEAAE
jgi:30S ribosomal protein S31